MNYYIGLLSGTSVDGIDAALVAIDKDSIELVNTHEQLFSSSLKDSIQSIIQSQSVNLKHLSDTDSLLALEFSQAVNQLLKKSQTSNKDIAAIGSHGQTIFHQPIGKLKNTMQIGSAHIIAANSGISVVSNFRNLDMAYGGQGAPLAPIIHQKLFYQADKNTAIINLGGIANISFIGKNYSQPIGFDTGPANCLMDEWIFKHKNKIFDKNGQWASKGELNPTLLDNMLNDEYFSRLPPKSTGREIFNQTWLKSMIPSHKSISPNNIQTTLAHLTAITISNAINKEQYPIDEIILMGGGANNTYLKNLIQKYCKIKSSTANEHGYDSDWIEAILFAYLAYMRIKEKHLNLSSFTGSSQTLLVGDIIDP